MKNIENKKMLYRVLGIILMVLGYGGVITCFVLFATVGFDGFDSDGPTLRLIIPFILFIPCGIVGAIGSMLISKSRMIGFEPQIANAMAQSLGNKCSACGTIVSKDKLFCTHCGNQVAKECPYCQAANDINNEYCGKCGTKL